MWSNPSDQSTAVSADPQAVFPDYPEICDPQVNRRFELTRSFARAEPAGMTNDGQ
jgi:hypothetical protein